MEVKISAGGVHNQSLLSRFLRDGKDADITHMTKSKGANARVKQALYDAKIRPPIPANSRVQQHFGYRQLKQGELSPPPLARRPN